MLQNTAKEPRYFENNPDDTQKHSNNKKEIATKKERFFITNIIKGHRVTDLTRPNELGTTTSKVVTRSPSRTRL
jgi:hypothetical protein